jgi:hypothetical protein
MNNGISLSDIVLGTANEQRLARDDEIISVAVIGLDPHINFYDGSETWRAWDVKLRPIDKRVADIKIRIYLDKKQNFAELGDGMRAITSRISHFADEKYGVKEFTLNDVIGAQLKIRHIRKDPNKPSQMVLLQVESVPALDPDVEYVPEVERGEDQSSNNANAKLAYELERESPFKNLEVED